MPAASAAAAHPTTVIVTQPAPPPPHPAAPPPPAVPSLQVAEQKLKDLKTLFDQGLISQSEYDAKKQQILQSF
jgi:hypothetical protein